MLFSRLIMISMLFCLFFFIQWSPSNFQLLIQFSQLRLLICEDMHFSWLRMISILFFVFFFIQWSASNFQLLMQLPQLWLLICEDMPFPQLRMISMLFFGLFFIHRSASNFQLFLQFSQLWGAQWGGQNTSNLDKNMSGNFWWYLCTEKKGRKSNKWCFLEHPTLHGGIQISLKLSQKYARNEVHIKEFFVSFTIEKFENILGMYGLHFLIYLK